ncbi:MAG: flagellin FliC [Rhodobacteraceae bacterium]|nr:MAG: flagellin FliC [Paracoccaceae bacterium]
MPTINTNVAAIKARSNLERVQRDMDTSIARLSSGKRITRAHDDAAGSAISGRMESQIRGLNMAIRSAKDGQSLVDTQEGALQEVTAILQRMRELAVQSGSGAITNTDRGYLDTEMENLVDEIAAISANTKFNDTAVLTGTQFKFYTDIDVAGTAITTVAANVAISGLGSFTATGGVHGLKKTRTDVTSISAVPKVISNVDMAIASVASMRANLGAVSNRFDHIIDNLTNVVANTESAKSRVEDADFATETTQLTRNTVLQQAATSMVAQANASKNTILALIQG